MQSDSVCSEIHGFTKVVSSVFFFARLGFPVMFSDDEGRETDEESASDGAVNGMVFRPTTSRTAVRSVAAKTQCAAVMKLPSEIDESAVAFGS